jgi:hypothetical protein
MILGRRLRHRGRRSAISLKSGRWRVSALSGARHAAKRLKGGGPRKVYELYYDFEFRVDRLTARCWRSIAAKKKRCCVSGRRARRDWRNAVENVFARTPALPGGQAGGYG